MPIEIQKSVNGQDAGAITVQLETNYQLNKTKTMKTKRSHNLLATALFAAVALTSTAVCAQDPLPSWNDGPAKQSIITFVEKVTKPGWPDFVPVPERIAVYDNDGTLWSEQPAPVQF